MIFAEDDSSDGMKDLVENKSDKFEDSEELEGSALNSSKLEDSAEFIDKLENGKTCVERGIHLNYDSVEENVESLIENNEHKNDDWVEVEGRGKERVGSGTGTRDNYKRNREVLERMMEDNEKMMRLMMQLFERNEMQTSMLSDLMHRVGQLEKAFTCDRLSRKKKKKKTLAAIRTE
ncbi:BAG domain-containing protein [Abeliophyllum distichum]|uniref:BAG domain-containing protein n=1 Tax=Abeliophyllum distichum TaxID=126358 RepID=A0ABD1TY38_9LAMI